MDQAQANVSGKLSVTSATLVVVTMAILLVPGSRAGHLVDAVPAYVVTAAAAVCIVVGIVLGHLARAAARRAGAEEDDVATVALVCHYLLLILGIVIQLEEPVRDALTQLLDGLS
ncbi:hypothetical protein [Demequina sp. NBRC 110052]|uniref:hypothetical protein n=1 Tax=Demequina sp. NBRC 110052 TaxID=1570341 RepID=UPI0009FF0B88|nr:hypothetical protein [Demequina sp. NBRC 110052]